MLSFTDRRKSQTKITPAESLPAQPNPAPLSGIEIPINGKTGRERFTPDLTATLTCKYDGKHWILALSHIIPSSTCQLIARDLPKNLTLSIDAFIPPHKRAYHQKSVDSILSEGEQSPHWSRLINKMLKDRYINILGYHPDAPSLSEHQIAIVMEMIEKKENEYIFKVEFYDNSAVCDAAKKAANMSHNLRGAFSSIVQETKHVRDQLSDIDGLIELAKDDPTQFRLLLSNIKTHMSHIDILSEEGLNACAPTFSSFLPESNQRKKNTTDDANKPEDINATLDMYVQNYLKLVIDQLRDGKAIIVYKTTNHLFLELHKIEPLKDLIYNLVKNAANAGATEILIESSNQESTYQCDVLDNGPGLTPALQYCFFTRPLAQKQKNPAGLEDILANRGEGSLLSYQNWTNVGGAAEDMPRPDGLQGTLFRLKNAGIPLMKKSALIAEHMTFMETQKETLHGIILLVDDSLSQIRFLAQNLTRDSHLIRSVLGDTHWPPGSLILIPYQNWVIACASDPEIALEFASAYPPSAIISDQEMGSCMGGMAFLNLVTKSIHPCPQLAIHSGDPKETIMESTSPELKDLDITFLAKGNRQALYSFLEMIHFVEKHAEDPGEATLPFCSRR